MIIRRDSALHLAFEGLDIYDYTAQKPGPSSVGVIEVPPGAGHREAYSTRSDKYYYVISGSLSLKLGGQEHDLGAGDLCYVARGTSFAYRNDTDTPTTTLLVHTPPFDLADEVFVD
ncbi:MAG TPA: cupin domain-containing protein [Dehalococcoidia bacterium]